MKMKILLCLCFILLALQNTQAQKSDSITIAMVLWRGATDAEQGFMQSFRNEPVRFVTYDCKKSMDKLVETVKLLRQDPPALIYSFGTTATLMLAGKFDATRTDQVITKTPIVFSVVADPNGAGLIPPKSKKSGRNLTGVSHLVPLDIQINAMQSVVPVRTIGALYNPNEENSRLQISQINDVSITHNIRSVVIALPVQPDGTISERDLIANLNKLISSNIDILYLPSDSYIISNAEKIINICHDRRIPTFSATEEPIRKNNALMGLVSRYNAVGAYTAYKAHMILKGVDPGSIPCENVPKFSLVLNMNACQSLNLYPPITMLRYAEVIKIDTVENAEHVAIK